MDLNSDQRILGIGFKIAIETRNIEIIEPSLIAAKDALQCTCRDDVEIDSKAYYDTLDQHAVFLAAINEIEKYDWEMIPSDSTYRINLPGYDVAYYYADPTTLQTHILKYYLVCYFSTDIADVPQNEPVELQPKTAAVETIPREPPLRAAANAHPAAPQPKPQLKPETETETAPASTRPVLRPFPDPVHHLRPVTSDLFAKGTLRYGLLAIAGGVVTLLAVALFNRVLTHTMPGPLPTPIQSQVAKTPSAPAPLGSPAQLPAEPLVLVPAAETPTGPVTTGPDEENASTAALRDTARTSGDTPTIALQKTLTSLGFFHGPLTGIAGPQTRKAIGDFTSAVPAPIRHQYGNNILAMAQAALRGDFPLTHPPAPSR